jgi:hypothetical protein
VLLPVIEDILRVAGGGLKARFVGYEAKNGLCF